MSRFPQRNRVGWPALMLAALVLAAGAVSTPAMGVSETAQGDHGAFCGCGIACRDGRMRCCCGGPPEDSTSSVAVVKTTTPTSETITTGCGCGVRQAPCRDASRPEGSGDAKGGAPALAANTAWQDERASGAGWIRSRADRAGGPAADPPLEPPEA